MDDLLVKFYIWYLRFNKVEKNFYQPSNDFKDIYLFESEIDYYKTLKDNGVDISIYPEILLESPIVRRFKNGNVIAFKGIYDKLIRLLSYDKVSEEENDMKKIIKFRK